MQLTALLEAAIRGSHELQFLSLLVYILIARGNGYMELQLG